MTERLKQELALLKTVFPDIELHEVENGWFRIPRFQVLCGGWKQTEVAVCFQVSAGYPGDAPYAFWVSPPLRQASNDAPPTTTTRSRRPRRFSAPGAKFSWTHEAGWKPGADPATGSNFLQFVRTFRDRFREGP